MLSHMIHFKALIPSLCILLAISLSFSMAIGQGQTAVSGIVVDELGKPVSGATVRLVSPRDSGQIGGALPVDRTDESGVFFLVDHLARQNAWLQIEGPQPNGVWNAVSPVNFTLSQFDEFIGIPIKQLGQNRTVQLGKVPLHIEYRTVFIDLHKLFQGDCLLFDNDARVSVEISYKEQLLLRETIVDDRTYDRKEHRLIFALPKAKWTVTLFLMTESHSTSRSLLMDLTGSDSQYRF